MIAMKRFQLCAMALMLSTSVAEADTRLTFVPSTGQAPLSKAVRVDDILYLSGQLGIGPDGKLVENFDGQAKQAMDNIQTVLTTQGASFDDVFKCIVFLTDMKTWGQFNKVYATYFKPDRLPTRSVIGVSTLSAGGALEVECTAFVPRDRAH
jgi:2-iminobutanoate/2-iminopropanoate deaminase